MGLKGLAALGLVGLMAGILVPVIGNTKAGSYRICASREMRLGVSLIQYEQDNDEAFPPGPSGNRAGWAGAIYPYVKSAEMYRCPDDRTNLVPGLSPVSYGFNRNLADTEAFMAEDEPKTVLLFEAEEVNAAVTLTDEGCSSGKRSLSAVGNGRNRNLTAGPWNHPHYAWRRHAGRSTIMFGDTHIGWLLPEEISRGNTAPSARSRRGRGRSVDFAARASDLASGKTPYRATFNVK